MQRPSDYYEKLTYGGNAFTPAKIKIKRANIHLHELEALADDFPRRRPYYFVFTKPRTMGSRKVVDIIYIPSNSMPMEFAATVGDTVHNIRAAFDYAAIALTCPPRGTGKQNKVYFPVGTDHQQFMEELKRKMKGAKPEAIKLVSALEPYRGGKYSIRELHELDISDKHRLIIPAQSMLRIENLEVIAGDGPIYLGTTDFQPNEDCSNFTATVEVPSAVDDETIQTTKGFNASFNIVFGKGFPLEGEAVVPSLQKLCDTASDFIEKSEALFGN